MLTEIKDSKPNCIYCGKEIYLNVYNKKFCSRKCQLDNWKIKNKERIQKYKIRWKIKTNYTEAKSLSKKKYADRWRKDNKNKIKMKEYVSRYRKRYPERDKCNRLSLKNIIIPEGQLCEICHKDIAMHRHHSDYSKPLEVQLICIRCHINIHKLVRAVFNHG